MAIRSMCTWPSRRLVATLLGEMRSLNKCQAWLACLHNQPSKRALGRLLDACRIRQIASQPSDAVVEGDLFWSQGCCTPLRAVICSRS